MLPDRIEEWNERLRVANQRGFDRVRINCEVIAEAMAELARIDAKIASIKSQLSAGQGRRG